MDTPISQKLKSAIESIARSDGFVEFDTTFGVATSKGDNYLSDIVRAVIRGRKSDASDAQLSLIVKIALKSPELTKGSFIRNFYVREIRIYAEMLPALYECQVVGNVPDADRFHFAKFYGGLIDDDSDDGEALIMEDLGARGLVMLSRHEPLDIEHLVVGIRSIARFHATSMVLREKDPIAFSTFCSLGLKFESCRHVLAGLFAGYIQPLKELIEHEPYNNTFTDLLDNVMKEIEPFYGPNEPSPYFVLAHRDCWINNILFRYQNGKPAEAVLVDWQLTKSSSPVIDLAHLLLLCIDSQTRNRHYHEMLDLYYETLSASLSRMGFDVSDCYPKDVYREHIKVYMKHGLLMSFCHYPLTLAEKQKERTMTEMVRESARKVSGGVVLSEKCQRTMKELFEDCLKLKIV